MKRKEFIASAGLIGVMPLVSGMNTSEIESTQPNHFFELIKYHLHPGANQSTVSDFYKNVAIPALNRIGISTVGVFSPVYGPDNLSLYVLIPHASIEAVYTDREKLFQDASFTNDGEKFLNAPIDHTAFVRMETSILRAFTTMPTVEVPVDLLSNENRIYEIRIYESPSMAAAKRKIAMFNEGGEIALFKKTGLRPVFFGETLAGLSMPNLTYMLVFNNMQERDENWSVFGKSSEWKSLSKNPYYKDTVSCITDIILKPTGFSQI